MMAITMSLYDVIMMSLCVEASSGDETSLEKSDIILLQPHKNQKDSTFIQELKVHIFF